MISTLTEYRLLRLTAKSSVTIFLTNPLYAKLSGLIQERRTDSRFGQQIVNQYQTAQ